MAVLGTVESLWRYPVKSMRGEELDELFVGYGGVYGDRLFAFESTANDKGFPFLPDATNGRLFDIGRASAIRKKRRVPSITRKQRDVRQM